MFVVQMERAWKKQFQPYEKLKIAK